MIVKKILAVFLNLCMLASCFNTALAQSNAENDLIEAYALANSGNTAVAVFGKEPLTKNISDIAISDRNCTLTTKDGVEVYAVKKESVKGSRSSVNGRIYIDIDDSFFCNNTDGSEFVVTVDYFDCDMTNFNIKYDGLYGITDSETFYTTNSGKLKKHSFVISDAKFSNGITKSGTSKGYDIELGYETYERAATPRTTYFAGITVKRIPAKYPVMAVIESDTTGHIFDYADKPHFTNTVTNYSDSAKTVNIKYTAQNKLGNVEWTASEKVSLSAHESKKIAVNPQINTYGLYYLTADIGGDFTAETQFSYINTAQDGLYNERLGVNVGINDERPVEYTETVLKLTKKLGTRNIRTSVYWQWNEGANGITMGHAKNSMEAVKNADMDPIWLIFGGNAQYGIGDNTLGTNLTQIGHYADFANYVIDNYGGDKIEIWNEPNLSSFATNGTAQNYAYFASNAAKLIHEKHPEVRLGALSLCGITSSESTHHTNEFTQELINTEAYQNGYLQAGTYHPYSWFGAPEKSGMLEGTMKLHDMITEQTGTNAKVWLTEVGWHTAQSSNAMHNPREQSAYHQRNFVIWDAEPELEYYDIYNLVKNGNLKDEQEDLFGIVDSDVASESGIPFLATEAYAALANMNNIMAGCSKPVKVETGISDVYAYKLKNEKRGNDILTFWRYSDKTNAAISVNLGTTSVTYVDSYGNETVLESDNGIYELVPDVELTYLVGDFDNVSITESDMTVSELNLNIESEGCASFTVDGINNASKAVIKEKKFVLSSGGNVKNGKAEFEVTAPELRDNKTSFTVLLKDGNAVRSAFRIYLDKQKNVGVGFKEDFSDFTLEYDTEINNRINNWWIEGSDNSDVKKYVWTETVTDRLGNTMKDALCLAPTANKSGVKSMRGGRAWTQYLQPGETMTVEMDIMAETGADLAIGMANSDTDKVEDCVGYVLFRLNPQSNGYDESKLYYGGAQNAWTDNKYAIGDLNFVRDEVNHIRIDYTLNSDVSNYTKDTMKVTLSNSAGDNQTKEIKTNYRTVGANQPSPLTAIKGITILKFDTTKKVYLDNVNVYLNETKTDAEKYYYLKENFATYENAPNDKGEPYKWRIETENNQTAGTDGKTFLSLENFENDKGDYLDSALKIGSTAGLNFPTNAASTKIRGGIGWEGEIGTGGWGGTWNENYAINVELDIVPQADTKFDLKLFTDKDEIPEHTYTISTLFYIEDGKIKTRGDSSNKENMNNLTLKFGEINHIKAQYVIHPNSASGKCSDQVVLTLTNSAGENQTQRDEYVNYKPEGNGFSKIKGIALWKYDSTSSVYIDNLEVYKENVTKPTATISSTDINEGENLTVSFDKEMCADSMKYIKILTADGSAVEYVGNLSDDGKTYTINASLKGGTEYILNVPTTVKDKTGISLLSEAEARFMPITLNSRLSVMDDEKESSSTDKISAGDEVIVNVTLSNDKNLQTVLLILAGYDENGKMTSIKSAKVTATKATKPVSMRAGDGVKYKVFMWNAFDGAPLCANLQ